MDTHSSSQLRRAVIRDVEVLSPGEVLGTILSARETGQQLVCGYLSESGSWHFDGRDAHEIVRPVLFPGLEPAADNRVRMSDPYGAVGMTDLDENHERLRAAGIQILPMQSLRLLKQSQALLDKRRDLEPPAVTSLIMTAQHAAAVSSVAQIARSITPTEISDR